MSYELARPPVSARSALGTRCSTLQLLEQVGDPTADLDDVRGARDLFLARRALVDRCGVGGVEGDAVSNLAYTGRAIGQPENRNDWQTPDEILEIARYVLGGIELDPMSSESAQTRVQADRYYTPADDAFSQRWESPRLWLNPPYGRGIFDSAIDKLATHYCTNTIGAALVLTNNVTETRSGAWLLATASAVWFPPKRIAFVGPDGAPVKGNTRGQMLTLLGGDWGMVSRLAEGRVIMCPKT